MERQEVRQLARRLRILYLAIVVNENIDKERVRNHTKELDLKARQFKRR